MSPSSDARDDRANNRSPPSSSHHSRHGGRRGGFRGGGRGPRGRGRHARDGGRDGGRDRRDRHDGGRTSGRDGGRVSSRLSRYGPSSSPEKREKPEKSPNPSPSKKEEESERNQQEERGTRPVASSGGRLANAGRSSGGRGRGGRSTPNFYQAPVAPGLHNATTYTSNGIAPQPPMMQMPAIVMPPPVPVVMTYVQPPPLINLPPEWSQHFTPQGVRYFFNALTGTSTYDPPELPSSNAQPTNSTQYGSWIEFKDASSGRLYYYNKDTRATVWEMPEEVRLEKAKGLALKEHDPQAQEEADAKRRKQEQDEEQAKVQYQHLSQDERCALFKAYLEEKNVLPQWRWQDAQRYISKEGLDKDPRWKYALTTAGQKKQTFAEYCTQAINKQTMEKRRQVKKNREDFLELLALYRSKILSIEWEDVADHAELYAMRKDRRWNAIDDLKEKQDLFEGFVRYQERKRQYAKARERQELRELFHSFLRHAMNESGESLVLHGQSRLNSELKQHIWRLLEAADGPFARLRDDTLEKYEVYDWTDDLIDELRREVQQKRRAERQKQREREDFVIKKLRDEQIPQMIADQTIHGGTSWTVWSTLLDTTVKDVEEDCVLSDKSKHLLFDEVVVKDLRTKLQPTADMLINIITKANASDPNGFLSSYDAFAAALTSGLKTSASNESNDQLQNSLQQLAASADSDIEYPPIVCQVFEMLVAMEAEKKHERKRSREYSSSPERSRSLKRFRERSRSRSRSYDRHVSSDHHHHHPPHPPHAQHPQRELVRYDNAYEVATEPAPVKISGGNLNVEEVIRQARLRMQQQQNEEQHSEVEEGEEVEE